MSLIKLSNYYQDDLVITKRMIALSSPAIPMPLCGLAPRTIMGSYTWTMVSKNVRNFTGNCCVGCSQYIPTHLFGNKELSCHEIYDIDYKNFRSELVGYTSLCRVCHLSWVHHQRITSIILEDESTTELKRQVKKDVTYIQSLFRYNNIKMPYEKKEFLEFLEIPFEDDNFLPQDPYQNNASIIDNWDKWRLVFNGKKYKPVVKNEDEWIAKYRKQDKFNIGKEENVDNIWIEASK